MTRRWICIAAWAGVLAGGCKSEQPPDRDRPTNHTSKPAPTTHKEFDALEATLDATLADNASRSCPREPLWGAFEPGPADSAVRAIMEPGPQLQTCFDAVGSEQADLPPSCATLPAAVRTAVSHEDACSPYLLGRNPPPESLLPYIRTAKALVSLGDAEVDAGRPYEAAKMWLDGIRLGQDLSRGGATWLEAMVAHGGTTVLIDHAHEVLENANLSDAHLDELREAVALLVASEPHPRTHMLADRFYGALYEVMPAFMPETWEPPGGYPPESPPRGDATPSEKRLLLLTWNTLEQLAEQQAEACPADADVSTCLRGIETLVGQLVEAAPSDRDAMQAFEADPSEANDEIIAASLQAMAAPSWSKYLERQAERRVALHALAIRLAVRGGASCPQPGDAELVIPGFGDALGVETHDGNVVLSAPPLIANDEPLQWTVRCATQHTP